MGKAKPYTAKTLQKAVDAYFDGIQTDTGYRVPPSIPSLCLSLGILPEEWREYSDREKHPDMHETVAFARLRIEAYLVTELFRGKSGIAAALGTFYESEAEEKQEAEGESVPVSEKLALIRTAARKIGEGA